MSGICVRNMLPEDYCNVYKLWCSVKGLGIRSIDDSEENIVRFVKRNPTTSFVATYDDKIIGTLLCGHDGRRGCFYHVCVSEKYRNNGIATKMSRAALDALKAEGINKVNLMAFKENEMGNKFWQALDWNMRQDVNLYEFNLNYDNVTEFVR